MLRTFGRVFCILLVAGAIAGGLYLLAGSPGAAGPVSAGPGVAPREAGGSPSDIAFLDESGGSREGFARRHGRRSEGGSGRGNGGHGEFSLGRGAGGALLTLLQVGVIVAVVAMLQKRSGKARRQAA